MSSSPCEKCGAETRHYPCAACNWQPPEWSRRESRDEYEGRPRLVLMFATNEDAQRWLDWYRGRKQKPRDLPAPDIDVVEIVAGRKWP